MRACWLPFGTAWVHYRIDEEHGDPFSLWETPPTGERAAAEKPSPELYTAMRLRQELETLDEPAQISADGGVFNLEFDLPLHAVSLVVWTVRLTAALQKVTGVACQSYEGLTGQAALMVTWTGLESRTIRTSEVLCASAIEGPYQRVNPADLLCSACLHVFPKTETLLFYAVRAFDYWARPHVGSSS